jgi:hypothetical protein
MIKMTNDKDQELEKKINAWWAGLKHLAKLEILNEIYGLDFSEIERQGLGNLWRKTGNLEKKKLIMETYEKEQRKGRG